MKKNIILIFVLLIVVNAYSQEKPTVSVLDFETNNISKMDMGTILAFLNSALFDTGNYRVIEMDQRDTILEEMEFSLSGCTDESCQVEIGRLLSAQYIVVGDLASIGGRFSLTARMISVETSETVSTTKGIYPDMGTLMDHMLVLALELAGEKEKAAQLAAEKNALGEQPEAKASVNGRTIAAWSTLGGGVIAGAVGGFLIYNALGYKAEYVDPAQAAYDDTSVIDFGELTPEAYYEELFTALRDVSDVFRGKALLALAVSAVGIASLGTSVSTVF